jgi:hypothetical protein
MHAADVCGEAEYHADAGGAERGGEAVRLLKGAAHQWRHCRTDVNCEWRVEKMWSAGALSASRQQVVSKSSASRLGGMGEGGGGD